MTTPHDNSLADSLNAARDPAGVEGEAEDEPVGHNISAAPSASPELPAALVPKSGFKTSSFYALIATLVVGGVFTWLTRKGVTGLEGHRSEAVQIVAHLFSEVAPTAYIVVSGWVASRFMKGRQQVSRMKMETVNNLVTQTTVKPAE